MRSKVFAGGKLDCDMGVAMSPVTTVRFLKLRAVAMESMWAFCVVEFEKAVTRDLGKISAR